MLENNESGGSRIESVWEASQRLALEFDLNRYLTPAAIRECASDAYMTVSALALQQSQNGRIVGDILEYEFLIRASRLNGRDLYEVEFELADNKKYASSDTKR